MFGTIRKHSKWLWIIIIGFTVVAFVIFFSPNQKMGGDRPSFDYGRINGKKISEEEFQAAAREVRLAIFLNSGEWVDGGSMRQRGFDLTQEAYVRLMLIHKIEEMGVQVSDEATAKFGAVILRSVGRGQPVSMESFATQVLRPHGIQAQDFRNFVRHELGRQQLASVVGLAGSLVTPQEARELYVRENQELAVQAAFFSASNHIANITVTPEALMQFYSNRMADYRIPERVQVTYVRFPISNYVAEATAQMAEVTNLNEIVEARYQQLGTNFFLEAKTPEEKKEKIREQFFKSQLLFNAHKAANAFATELFDMPETKPENLEQLARTKNLPVEVTEPFDAEEGPKEIEVDQTFTRAAFNLTTNEPFAEPLVGDDGVYVIALKRRVPSENPPFETVREKVEQDYKFSQAALAARREGNEFHAAVTNGLAAGKSFADICAEQNVKPVSPKPFSMSTQEVPEVEEHVDSLLFRRVAFSTEPGKVSSFVPTATGGFVMFVQAKLPIDESKVVAALPEFTKYVQQAREGEAFQAWFQREAERGLRDIPYFREMQNRQAGPGPLPN